MLAVSRFAQFLDAHHPGAHSEAAITRAALEAFLPWLAATGLGGATRLDGLVNLRSFLEHCRRHNWLADLAPTATLYSEDFPTRIAPLPRFVSEFVMAQLESETNLARLGSPTLVNLVVVVIETGLRIGDATALPFDATITDSTGWPCLRFLNSKMGAEQLIPLSAKAAAAISAQQQHLVANEGRQPPLLFPTRYANPDQTKPFTIASVARRLRRWQAEIDLHDEGGQPVRVTPHQFRHTLGTRMINQGVPQHVVQKLLGPCLSGDDRHLRPPARLNRQGRVRSVLRRPGQRRRGAVALRHRRTDSRRGVDQASNGPRR